MMKIKTLFLLQWKIWLNDPLFYVSILVFQWGWSLSIAQQFTLVINTQSSLAPYFKIMPYILTFLIPLLSTQIWNQEKVSFQTCWLYQWPLKTIQIIWIKWLCLMSFFFLFLILTLPLSIILSFLGHFDQGILWSCYLSVFLFSSVSISFCGWIILCFSSFWSGFFMSFALLTLVNFSSLLVHVWNAPEWLNALLEGISFNEQAQNIMSGLISLQDIVFFLSLSVFFLWCQYSMICFSKRGKHAF